MFARWTMACLLHSMIGCRARIPTGGAAFLSTARLSSSTSHHDALTSRLGAAPSRTYHATNHNAEEVTQPKSRVPFFPIYYNDVYEVNMPPGHRFPMGKYRKVREAVQAKVNSLPEVEKQRVQCEFRVSPLATKEQLITTHDAHYVHRYLSGDMTQAENRNIGFPWSLQHVNRTLSSVGGTVAAACAAWEECIRRHEMLEEANNAGEQMQHQQQHQHDNMHLCWAAHVAGGTHHAFKDYGEGFCIFSDIAVAVNVLLERYSPSSTQNDSPISLRRILIIDLDVHQGNGNAALFENNTRVQTFSMQCSANYFSKKEVSDLDVELPIGCNDETYLSTLKYWLKRIEEHDFDPDVDGTDSEQNEDETRNNKQKQFDLIFFQSGVDIHEDDRLGRLAVTQAGISTRNSIVFDFANRMECPLVITMGGGYPKSDNWKSIIDAHASVYWEAHQYLSEKC